LVRNKNVREKRKRIRFLSASEAKLKGGQSNVDHMRGTECDIRVRSATESSHTIMSPNFPQQYPLNRTCVYFLDGLQGPQHLEKVVLTFEAFAIASKVE